MTITQSESNAASAQGALWGARAADWAELHERFGEPIYEAAFAKCAVGDGTRLIDIGCGAGDAAAMATERSARVAGIDASTEMIAIARRRTPSAEFRVGDMQQLPWPDDTYDVATFFNSLELAASPVDALRESARVTRRGGRIAIAAWGEPERCEAAPYIAALRSLVPRSASQPERTALWAPMALRSVIESAGLGMIAMCEVTCAWIYREAAIAARALMAGALAARAIEAVGEARVADTILDLIVPFRRRDGSYRLDNVFRVAIAEV